MKAFIDCSRKGRQRRRASQVSSSRRIAQTRTGTWLLLLARPRAPSVLRHDPCDDSKRGYNGCGNCDRDRKQPDPVPDHQMSSCRLAGECAFGVTVPLLETRGCVPSFARRLLSASRRKRPARLRASIRSAPPGMRRASSSACSAAFQSSSTSAMDGQCYAACACAHGAVSSKALHFL
jgi:hypothetical protein